MKNISRSILLLGMFMTIALIGIGTYYYRVIYIPAHEDALIAMSIKNSQPARDAFNKGDYTTSIDVLQPLISKAPTKTERGRLQLLLASDLSARNQGSDFVQATNLLKQIIGDYSITPWVRAMALNNIAKIAADKGVDSYNNLFADSLLGVYSPPSGNDSSWMGVGFKVLRLSDDTYPNSFAEYVMAGNYYAEALQNSGYSEGERVDFAKKIQQYIKEGDSRNDQSLYSPVSILTGQYYRALGLSASSRILKNINLADQEKAFQTTVSTAMAYQQQQGSIVNKGIAAILLKADFSYADFLLQNYGLTRKNEIIALLAPFRDPGVATLDIEPLNSLASFPDSKHTKIEAIRLSSVSSDFKAFLISTGVVFQ